MSVYIPIRSVDDIQTAVQLLIEEAVEKVTDELETYYENKIEDLETDHQREIMSLQETIADLELQVKELQEELMND